MVDVRDEFGGLGENFEGFPKRLPDDCIEYSLFVIDAKLQSNKERFARLETIRKEALKITNDLLKEYIWQREPFKLEVDGKDGLMYLSGLTNYGDSIEDEWLIVYILCELSKIFSDLWIQVVDTDGEFLLIEAANALPKWLNPEVAGNRVWINNQQLRIIPQTASSHSKDGKHSLGRSRTISQDDAVRIIASGSPSLLHSPMIEEEAFFRLRNYPDQISHSLHYSKITIPRKLAYILHNLPAAIAPAVESFYLRDPVSLKPLQSPSDNLIFSPQDLVPVSTKFTKVLYAQLKAQHFPPPDAWTERFIEAGRSPSDTTDVSRLETGMKLACGFEMLVTDQKNKDNRRVREIAILLEDLAAGETLPSDAEIAAWPNVGRDDDEKWLDINFEDFDAELQGNRNGGTSKKHGVPGAFGPEPPPGFGDAKTRDDLRKMVERFEAFLNDDEAGIDGAEEVDEMDIDDDDSNDSDDDDSNDSDDDDEDKEVSFDEAEFARMMREMMGMPSEEEEAKTTVRGKPAQSRGKEKAVEVVDSDDSDATEEVEDEESEIRDIMERMEAELKEAGALNLASKPENFAALPAKQLDTATNHGQDGPIHDEIAERSDDEIDIDFNLAKNLLESFKSQGGTAGPGGNMLGMMGIRLPRDADDERSL